MDNSKSQVAGQSKIRWLINKTSEDWIDLAISNPMEILLDHAHCERKAAGVALQLMFRYVDGYLCFVCLCCLVDCCSGSSLYLSALLLR